eukprot:TRINITY_DN93457_c0_g1_i1.p1 TRINITY_DN93457_c0_g1~~TRINITY_DN93457_c0_g1_i1.p1  ORF type:complete len:411 (+),score=80.06 TRINITY_DN93457_c0_g1_i1:127-1233(+)
MDLSRCSASPLIRKADRNDRILQQRRRGANAIGLKSRDGRSLQSPSSSILGAATAVLPSSNSVASLSTKHSTLPGGALRQAGLRRSQSAVGCFSSGSASSSSSSGVATPPIVADEDIDIQLRLFAALQDHAGPGSKMPRQGRPIAVDTSIDEAAVSALAESPASRPATRRHARAGRSSTEAVDEKRIDKAVTASGVAQLSTSNVGLAKLPRSVVIVDEKGDGGNRIQRKATGFINFEDSLTDFMGSLKRKHQLVRIKDDKVNDGIPIQRQATGFVSLEFDEADFGLRKAVVADSKPNGGRKINRQCTGFVRLDAGKQAFLEAIENMVVGEELDKKPFYGFTDSWKDAVMLDLSSSRPFPWQQTAQARD